MDYLVSGLCLLLERRSQLIENLKMLVDTQAMEVLNNSLRDALVFDLKNVMSSA